MNAGTTIANIVVLAIYVALIAIYFTLIWKNYKFYSNIVTNPDDPLDRDTAKSLKNLYLTVFIINASLLGLMVLGGLILALAGRFN